MVAQIGTRRMPNECMREDVQPFARFFMNGCKKRRIPVEQARVAYIDKN
jgi:hypothetical protein